VDAGTARENRANHAEGSRHTVVTNQATILGSKQKVRTIEDLLEEQSAEPAFTSFCARVSKAIQALGSESADAIAINDQHQV